MKYIEADLLQEKIKELITESNNRQANLEAIHQEGADVIESPIRAILKSLLSFIDSLQQEQSEMDLEKALNSLDDVYFDLDGIAVIGATYYLTVEDLKDIARRFYELGKNSK